MFVKCPFECHNVVTANLMYNSWNSDRDAFSSAIPYILSQRKRISFFPVHYLSAGGVYSLRFLLNWRTREQSVKFGRQWRYLHETIGHCFWISPSVVHAREAFLTLHNLLQVCNFKRPPGLASVMLSLWHNLEEPWNSVEYKKSPMRGDWKCRGNNAVTMIMTATLSTSESVTARTARQQLQMLMTPN